MSASPTRPAPAPAGRTAQSTAEDEVTLADAGAGRRAKLVEALAGRWRMLPVLATLIALWGLFAAASPVFLTSRNLSNLAVQIVVTGILALGLVLVLLVGQIDLSVAALSGVAAGIMGQLSVGLGWNIGLAIAVAILAGATVGLLYGALVTRSSAPAFIVTLGGALILKGVLLQLLPRAGQLPLSGTTIATAVNGFLSPATGYALVLTACLLFGALRVQSHRQERTLGLRINPVREHLLPFAVVTAAAMLVVAVFNTYRGVPVPVAVFLALLLFAWFLTTQTAFGTYLYAIGGNAEAARRAGIPVRTIITTAFMIASGLAALGGVIAAARVLGVSPQSGSDTLLLEAVAAAVIGGASLFGGRGSVWAALLGALVIGTISNGLDLIGVSSQVKLMTQGGILVTAVVTDGFITRTSAARN